MTRTPRTPHPARRSGGGPAGLHDELRAAVAAAHHLDPVELRRRADAPVVVDAVFDLLGADPVRSGADALARIDALARELVARMDAAGWSAAAAPAAVTSVLAASVPAAEAALRRHARRAGPVRALGR